MALEADKHDGLQAELRFMAELTRRGYTNLRLMNGQFSDWDIECSGGTFEVKHDRLALQTKRFFVETAYKGQPGGLYSTKADYFVLVIGDDAWVGKASMWIEWLEKHHVYKGFKKIRAGDNGASEGYLIDLDIIHKVFGIECWKLA